MIKRCKHCLGFIQMRNGAWYHMTDGYKHPAQPEDED